MRAFSSVGRALPLQGRCREFEPLNAQSKKDYPKWIVLFRLKIAKRGISLHDGEFSSLKNLTFSQLYFIFDINNSYFRVSGSGCSLHHEIKNFYSVAPDSPLTNSPKVYKKI